MKIGIEISSLQGPHRLRGIGYVAANFIKNIPATDDVSFVLYGDPSGEVPLNSVIEELDLNHLRYEVRYLKNIHKVKELPGKLRYVSKLFKNIRELLSYTLGDRRVQRTHDLDAFLQLDQSSALPKLRLGKHVYFIAYDVIPYVLEADYLWSFKTARQHGFSRRGALKCSARRWLYIAKIRANSRRATKIFAISKTTQYDFEKYVHTPTRKLVPVTIGLSVKTHKKSTVDGTVNRYLSTSWGYLPKEVSLKNKKFLLFVGGADHRRRLDDLVTAFNHLRAQNYDISLVLSGDSMQGPRNIATHSIQRALVNSSYSDDIYYVGFSDDTTRDWLYENALAFIFPSVYEGFGLPILEAMSYGTPVICYKNQAVNEVASTIPFYASDALEIKNHVLEILKTSPKTLEERTYRGKKQAAKYKWEHASKEILDQIITI